jgi:hypothetical protein
MSYIWVSNMQTSLKKSILQFLKVKNINTYSKKHSSVYQCSWGEFSFNWGLGYIVHHDDEQSHITFHLIYLSVFIYTKKTYDNESRYGAQIAFGNIHCYWKEYVKLIPIVLHQTLYKRSIYTTKNIRRYTGTDVWNTDEDSTREAYIIPFQYKLSDGIIQEREARVIGVEAEYRYFKTLGLFRSIYRYINIEFDEEVGDEIVSWKGGVLGTTYDWNKDETIEECFARALAEHKW